MKYWISPFLVSFKNKNNIILFNQLNYAIVEVNKGLWSELLEYINNPYKLPKNQALIELINDLQKTSILQIMI